MSEDIITDIELEMTISIEHLIEEFGKIRTGRANPNLVTSIQVDYYGTKTPLQQLASVSVPDPRLLVIQPFDKSSFEEIEKAIQNADIGLNPATDGEIIRIPIPPLSEERRVDLTKYIHKLAEDGRIAVRNVRKDAINHLRILQKEDHISEDEIKRSETEIQNFTDSHVKTLNEIMESKEKEIMLV